MFTDDMFTTALPFLQRGLETSLDLKVVDSIINNSFEGLSEKVRFGASGGPNAIVGVVSNTSNPPSLLGVGSSGSASGVNTPASFSIF